MKHAAMIYGLVFILTGCLQLKDDYLCVNDGGPGIGYCNKILSDSPIHVDNGAQKFTDTTGKVYSWEELKQVSIMMPPGTWSDIKHFIAQYCHENPDQCNGAGQWGSVSKLLSTKDQL